MAAGSQYGYYPPGEARRPEPPPPPPDQAGGWQEGPPRPTETGIPPASYSPMGDIIRPRAAAHIALLGIIIFFIGSIIMQATIFIEAPDYNDYDYDEYDKYEKDRKDYQRLVNNISGSGRILNWVGAMIICVPLYVVGISGENLDWKVKSSMLTSATAVVIFTMLLAGGSIY